MRKINIDGPLWLIELIIFSMLLGMFLWIYEALVYIMLGFCDHSVNLMNIPVGLAVGLTCVLFLFYDFKSIGEILFPCFYDWLHRDLNDDELSAVFNHDKTINNCLSRKSSRNR